MINDLGKNKIFYFLLTIFIAHLGQFLYAQGNMADKTQTGYFDYDDSKDTLQCKGEVPSEYYLCTITLSSNKPVIFSVKENNYCSRLSIYGTKQKGEIVLDCFIRPLNIGHFFYYKYNKNDNNWYLKERRYSENVTNPDDPYVSASYRNFSKKWSLTDDLRDLITDLPQDLNKINKKGLTEYRNKNYDEAINYFTQAYIIDSKNEEVLGNLAISYISNGEGEVATIYIEKLIKIASDPKILASAYYNWGLALQKMEQPRPDEAKVKFQTSLKYRKTKAARDAIAALK